MHIKETFPELYQIRRPLQTEEARAALAGKSGREFWQSLEELAATPEFEELIHREFPQQATAWEEGTDRRTFLKLMGASLALAGLSGCSYQPPESIIPYVSQPEEIVPGKPLYFATAMPFAGGATPLLARSNDGRPTKLEGNNLHPASGGAADVFAQAAILSLYDPDRSETIINRGEVRSYTAFLAEMATLLEGQRQKQGAGLRFLTETVTSPTLAAQLRDIQRRFPAARWHQWEPGGAGTNAAATQLAFGAPATPLYRFDQADRVLSLDANFLECGPGALRYARDFAARRRVRDGETRESARLYAVETTPTNTGVFADHRLPVRPSEFDAVVRAIAAGVGVGAGPQQLPAEQARFVAAVVEDLRAHQGRSVVVAGDEQSPQLHALAHAMNAALGNNGRTVAYLAPVEENPVDQVADLRQLITDIDAGAVEMLVIVGGNPVYNTPADISLRERMLKVPMTVHLSLYNDETSELCHWHVPEAHFLESWGDARAFDGTVCLSQPLVQPLYNGKSAYEFLAAFSEQPERTGYQILREHWSRPGAVEEAAGPAPAAAPRPAAAAPQPAGAAPPPAGTPAPPAGPPVAAAPRPVPTPAADFEPQWRRWVHDGFIPGTAKRESAVAVAAGFGAGLGEVPVAPAGERPFEIVFRTDPTVYDGRFANNGWLQELPKPLTKLTWDNAAIISPATAERLGVGVAPDGALVDKHPPRVNRYTAKGGEARAEVVRLRFRGREVTAPVWIFPGQPDGVVTVHLGYGRWRGGQIAGGKENTFEEPGTVGFNAYKLRTSDALWSGQGLEVSLTGEEYSLASTQIHFNMEGRDIVRHGSFEEWRRDPHLGHAAHPEMTLYPEYDYDEGDYNSRGYKWGMVIDLSTCVGCNACVVACQAENNIPVVGKEQVARSREMHWLRVDAYFHGAVSAPGGVYFMPVPCMHCENAPCEPVCPVHATVHSAEGLNDMVYNRCIGTRYCSNNCPYKVRRFNFLLYQDWDTPSLKMMRNPDVTVRSRGVMEKCTYCVQRISHARIEAEKEGRKVRDGEVQSACQATCPTESIIFGDLNDPQSRVHQLHAQKSRYDLLGELNTRPRTVYLSAVRNPNKALEG